MIDSSPIETFEGAAAIFTFAGTGAVEFFFWLMVALCIVPLIVSLKAENAAEREHG